jgi:hypothetical protein
MSRISTVSWCTTLAWCRTLTNCGTIIAQKTISWIRQSKISICSLRICGLRVPVDNVSTVALTHNIAVATLFFKALLRESGMFAFRGAVEYSTTQQVERCVNVEDLFNDLFLYISAFKRFRPQSDARNVI